MDKKISPVMDLPDFKLKKVGKDREKRKTGMPWFPQMGRTAQGALATGGRGFLAAFVGSRIGLMALMAALTAGSWGLGKVLADAEQSDAGRAISKPTRAEKTQYDGDLSNLPGRENRGQSGLGMAGSMSAPKPAEAVDAGEAPAADASAEAGDAAASGEAPAAEAPVADASDPAGQAGPTKASPFGARPGGLAGMSGLSGGAGMSGGINRSFGGASLKAGKISAPRASAKPTRATSSRASIRNSMGRSLSRRQLSTAHQFGRAARKGGDENRSSNASSAFENNGPAGVALTGAGIAEGTPPPQGSPDGGGLSGNPSGGGGGDGETTTPITCGTGTHLSADKTTCLANAQNSDNAKNIIGMVKTLSYILVALLLIQAILTKFPTLYTPAVKAILSFCILAVGAALFGCGIALFAMGRSDLAWVTTATGAMGMYFSYWGSEGAGFWLGLTWTGLGAFLGSAYIASQADQWEEQATAQDWG